MRLYKPCSECRFFLGDEFWCNLGFNIKKLVDIIFVLYGGKDEGE